MNKTLAFLAVWFFTDFNLNMDIFGFKVSLSNNGTKSLPANTLKVKPKSDNAG